MTAVNVSGADEHDDPVAALAKKQGEEVHTIPELRRYPLSC
jgi:hypothetical protein